jgi:hypothetical protein
MSNTAKGKAEAIRLFKKHGSEPHTRQEMTFAVNYLMFFGYLSAELIKNISYEDLKKGVKLFQKMFGVKATGDLDQKTIRAMAVPRCGCPDFIDSGNKQHIQFLKAQESSGKYKDRWNKQGLTYFIESYVTGAVSKQEQRQVIAKAFKAWQDLCDIEIIETKSGDSADLIISTGQGPQNHFDGGGGTLAWAYMPNGTDRQLTMKFDLDETWTTQPDARGIQLLNVACHEFGHLLGLTHSKRPGALMAPYYNPFIAMPQHDDDVIRIQKLYGASKQKISLNSTATADLFIGLKSGQRLIVSCEE